MIKNWLLTGDCHGDMTRFIIRAGRNLNGHTDEETGYIILGDSGVNFWEDKRDDRTKQQLEDTGAYYFLIRGNHDRRPEHVDGIQMVYSAEVKNWCLQEPRFPHIYYLVDGLTYFFGSYSALVIGGAYSVDKWYRLSRAELTGEEDYETMARKALWFADEQLSRDEMASVEDLITAGPADVDFIFTHTCPIKWVPTDQLLSSVDQSTVDRTMENWLEHIFDLIHWQIACFGHYHLDRVERPHVECFYKDIDSLDTIYNRWCEERTIRHEWWLNKSPNYYLKGDTPFDYELEEER